ncbi:MAG: hypothetical protein COW84_10350 [Gammaproteobacteria bacterium CG22_combo_CG10-13_8_21_14_all_40_8]|nr:MAG: hypothetical protein COW84_10350 [Gammaproteobacteria bacterium CG22_combo_CG10-13_8_21_14_all_40_8]
MLLNNKPLLSIIGTFLMLTGIPIQATNINLSGRSEADMKRDLTSKPAEIIHFAGVKEGDKVLDLLGGGGYYSEILSRVVGNKGQVVLQIPKAYLPYVDKELEQRLAYNRLPNVKKLLSEAPELNLGTNQFDSIFLVMGYHDMFFEDKGWDFGEKMVMPQVIKSLKSGGKLIIIDHAAQKDHGITDTKTLHRIEKSFVESSLEKQGFNLIKESTILKNTTDDHSLIVFDPKVKSKTDRFVLLFQKQ